MHFATPDATVAFEIPDEWWTFAEMDGFSDGEYYPYPVGQADKVQVVPIAEVQPPLRNKGVPPFKKYKMLPVLFAFASPECAMPAVEVTACSEGPYRYRVQNGYHRYYASVAVGFTQLPVTLREPFEP
jgi:hypothetical protein